MYMLRMDTLRLRAYVPNRSQQLYNPPACATFELVPDLHTYVYYKGDQLR